MAEIEKKSKRRKKKRVKSKEGRWVLPLSGILSATLIAFLMNRMKHRPGVQSNFIFTAGVIIWLASMFVLWAILRDRRKHRNSRDSHPTIGTDYRDQLE